MLVMLALSADLAKAHIPIIYITDASEDWCSVIATAKGGDSVMFQPGTYTGSCEVEARPDDKKEPLTILQAFDVEDPPVFSPGPDDDFVFRVWGLDLVMLELVFTGGNADTTMVLADDIDKLFLRFVHMRDVPGTGLRFEGDVDEIGVLNSTFERVAHPVDLSCTKECSLQSYLVDNSLFVDPVTAIRIGEPAPGEVRDVLVFGASDAAVDATVGIGPLVQGVMLDSRGDALRVQQPLAIRNSVLLGDTAAVRYASAPSSAVPFESNTLFGPIVAPETGAGPIQVISSALDRALASEIEASSNVVCTEPDACFADPSSFDFLPRSDGPLVDAGAATTVDSDWCGNPRGTPPDAGAFETREDHVSKGGIPLEIKDLWDCRFPRDDPFPEETGATGDTGLPGTDEPARGCSGCQALPAPAATSAGAASWAASWLLVALGISLRRRGLRPPPPAPGDASRTQ